MKKDMPAKTCSDSETVITELMIPSYANFGGKIHGGIILSLMDKVAYACASKHAGSYCVTVSVDVVDFRQPVEVGELISLKARVNYVGNTSLVVGIRVESENVKTGVVHHTNTSYFTMVAKGDDNELVQVPPLKLLTKVEVRRFKEAMLRKELKSQHKSEINESKMAFDLNNILEELTHQRCELAENLG